MFEATTILACRGKEARQSLAVMDKSLSAIQFLKTMLQKSVSSIMEKF